MGRFVMLAENVFNTRVFRSHVLGASGEAPGREVDFVNSGRRQKSQNLWTPPGGSENAIAYVSSTFDRVRMIDMLAIDRDHNLDGKVVRVRVSSNGFTNYTEVAATVPSQVLPYSRLSFTNGVRTEEGAWIWRFGPLAGNAVRVVIDAMGVGLRPEIVGLYVGQAYRPENALRKPFTHGKRELDYPMTKSPAAWVGAGEISQRRRGQYRLRVSREDYPLGRYHVEGLYLRGRPTWIVPDDEEAEKAWLSRAEPQTAGFEIPEGRNDYHCDLDCPEHEPRVA